MSQLPTPDFVSEPKNSSGSCNDGLQLIGDGVPSKEETSRLRINERILPQHIVSEHERCITPHHSPTSPGAQLLSYPKRTTKSSRVKHYLRNWWLLVVLGISFSWVATPYSCYDRRVVEVR